jgi:arylsulfatase
MNIKRKGNLKIQLFNLNNDIQEQHDVAIQHPKVVREIKHIMAKEHTVPEVDHFRMKSLQNGSK